MPTPTNLRFLSLSLSLLLSFHFTRPDISPSPSPGPEPDSSSGSPPSPSPSPLADGPATISNAPSPSSVADGLATISNAPSPSPVADGPAKVINAQSPSPVAGGAATLSNPPSPSAIADGPNSVFDGPSTSPEADGPTADSDGPSTSPEADGLAADSDGTSLSDDVPTRRSEPTLSPSPDADSATVADLPQFDSSAASANLKVKEICDSTDHPDLCLATVLPHLHGDSNVPAVLEITIRRSSDLAKVGLTMARTMTNNSSIPQEQASIFNDCRDSYDYAVYNFESALDAFIGRDVDTMRSMLNAVITDVGDCEEGLSRYGLESPFTNVAEKLVDMTNNCLAIVSLLN